MRIGYPCINYTVGCRGNRTFRLKSYSDRYLKATVESNLTCLLQILKYNVRHQLTFFRITSDLVPFASHPICTFDWQTHFASIFLEIGAFIRKYNIRISMHPDQFTLINAEKESIFKRSQAELLYHVQVMEALGADKTAKIQIHVGGLYSNRTASVRRFVRRYHQLDERLREHLVIENDDYNFPINDCMQIYQETGVPVVPDIFHHAILNKRESLTDILGVVERTWKKGHHGPMIVDYSSQQPNARKGTHAKSLDSADFRQFIEDSCPYDFDLMLEIKDKECSAIKAVRIVKKDPRFIRSISAIDNPLPRQLAYL
ncbi:UV DNA damage repair endonuclease UvsE [bacterium]|nr:UV DNA damage repair endonuclease UvsE [bacterium]